MKSMRYLLPLAGACLMLAILQGQSAQEKDRFRADNTDRSPVDVAGSVVGKCRRRHEIGAGSIAVARLGDDAAKFVIGEIDRAGWGRALSICGRNENRQGNDMTLSEPEA